MHLQSSETLAKKCLYTRIQANGVGETLLNLRVKEGVKWVLSFKITLLLAQFYSQWQWNRSE